MTMKKMISLALVACMALALAVPVGAAGTSVGQKNSYGVNAVEGDDVSIIPSNVAETLALMFVGSNVEANLTDTWTEDTTAKEVMPLYDGEGTPTAFSVELTTDGEDTGYIIISAYPGATDYIMEYSDTALPIYDNLNVKDGDSIVYIAPMTYLKDDGTDMLTTLQNQVVKKSSVENAFVEIREESLKKNKETLRDFFTNDPIQVTSTIYDYGPIDDPIAYIDAVYGGGAYNKAYEWKNVLGTYVKHREMDQFSSVYTNYNCGPTALTNLIETAGNFYNISAIKNKNINTIYANIEKIGLDNGWFAMDSYSGRPGTYFATMNNYMDTVLNSYGVSHQMTRKWNTSSTTYNLIKQEIDANHFCILGITDELNVTYKNHFVYPYAYTRFRNSQTGNYKSFLKVADGWTDTGRYVDMSTIVSGSGMPSDASYLYTVSISA